MNSALKISRGQSHFTREGEISGHRRVGAFPFSFSFMPFLFFHIASIILTFFFPLFLPLFLSLFFSTTSSVPSPFSPLLALFLSFLSPSPFSAPISSPFLFFFCLDNRFSFPHCPFLPFTPWLNPLPALSLALYTLLPLAVKFRDRGRGRGWKNS